MRKMCVVKIIEASLVQNLPKDKEHRLVYLQEVFNEKHIVS